MAARSRIVCSCVVFVVGQMSASQVSILQAANVDVSAALMFEL